MHTDKAYYVKDRFHDRDARSVSVLYKSQANNNVLESKESNLDPDQYPIAYGIGSLHSDCPPGLEPLHALSRVYFLKRLATLESDKLGMYRGEFIDDDDNRIFLLTSALRYDSDEVLKFALGAEQKLKGKVSYGVVNYAGIQVVEIYGDPEKIIRVGPSSAVWGEVQVVPGDVWNRIGFCCCCYGTKQQRKKEAQIRVVVMKQENKSRIWESEKQTMYKNVYCLRGSITTGCGHQKNNPFYRRSFDLKIFAGDLPSNEHQDSVRNRENYMQDAPVPIGRLCSQEMHNFMGIHLPVLEFPESLDIYDKLTLMGTFFIFSLKV